MKTKVLFAVLAIVATTMASCKKDYVCSCKKVYTGSSTTVSTDDGNYTFNDTKAGAVDKCNAQQGTGNDIGGDYSRNCSIQ